MVGHLGPVWVRATPDASPVAEPREHAVAMASAPPIVYAGFWLRAVALMIDSFILGAVFAAIATIYGNEFMIIPDVSAQFRFAMPQLTGAGWGLILILTWMYYAAFESSAWQGTPGKRVLGLYVTDLGGRRLNFWRASLRSLARFISYFSLYIGFIVAGFTARKQALHDLLTGCLVLRRPRRS